VKYGCGGKLRETSRQRVQTRAWFRGGGGGKRGAKEGRAVKKEDGRKKPPF